VPKPELETFAYDQHVSRVQTHDELITKIQHILQHLKTQIHLCSSQENILCKCTQSPEFLPESLTDLGKQPKQDLRIFQLETSFRLE
jgi:hypothetical protein